LRTGNHRGEEKKNCQENGERPVVTTFHSANVQKTLTLKKMSTA
jgi:hypothetical protein